MSFTVKIDQSFSSFSGDPDRPASRSPQQTHRQILFEGLGKELQGQVGEFGESLEAISRQKDTKRFYSELNTLAREMERGGKGAVAFRVYGLVAKGAGASEGVKSQALDRMRVMEGKGNFVEQMGMFGEKFGEVIFDKPTLLGMGLVPIGGGLGMIGGIKWAKRWGQWGMRAEAIKRVARFGGEVLAFTSGVSGVRRLMGEDVTAERYLKDLEGAVYLFGGIHVARGMGLFGHGKIFRKNPEGMLARITRPVVGQLGMGTGIGVGNYLSMRRSLIEDMGWEGLAGRSAAEWIQYNIVGLAAHGTVGRVLGPWQARLEGKAQAMELGRRTKGLGDYLEGMRGRARAWGERAGATMDRAGEILFPNAKNLGASQAVTNTGARILNSRDAKTETGIFMANDSTFGKKEGGIFNPGDAKRTPGTPRSGELSVGGRSSGFIKRPLTANDLITLFFNDKPPGDGKYISDLVDAHDLQKSLSEGTIHATLTPVSVGSLPRIYAVVLLPVSPKKVMETLCNIPGMSEWQARLDYFRVVGEDAMEPSALIKALQFSGDKPITQTVEGRFNTGMFPFYGRFRLTYQNIKGGFQMSWRLTGKQEAPKGEGRGMVMEINGSSFTMIEAPFAPGHTLMGYRLHVEASAALNAALLLYLPGKQIKELPIFFSGLYNRAVDPNFTSKRLDPLGLKFDQGSSLSGFKFQEIEPLKVK